MRNDVARNIYMAGAEDAYNFLSDWLDAYYEDGNAWKDFRERMEIQWIIRKEELSITTVL